MTVLAIDQGTSATKALVHDGERVLAVAESRLHLTYGEGGRVEVAPAALLASVLEAGRKALADAGDPPLSVLSLANQGETVLAWDPSDGTPLSPALVWQDRRAEEICSELRHHNDELVARTGLALSPYFSAPKMAWLRRHVTQRGVVTTTDSWLVHRLTGEFVTDVTTASRSMLLDVDSLSWSPQMLDLFGLEDERLPRIVGNDELVGHTTAFGQQVPIGGLVVDQQAALAAQRCFAPGAAKCTYGTGAFLLANTGEQAVRSSSGLTTSVAWLLRKERAYCLDGQVYTAGAAVTWLTRTGLLSSPQDLDRECGDHAGGVLFVPGLAGLATPWWTSRPLGALLGMSLQTERPHLVRAVLEGLACQVTALADEAGREVGTPITTLHVDGGLTRSAVLMQLQADLLQVPVVCFPSPHATALGAVATARLTLDPSLVLERAVDKWQATVTYEPRWSSDRAAETMANWRAAVNAAIYLAETS